MSGMCPWCRLTDRPTSVNADQIACKHPWHGRASDRPTFPGAESLPKLPELPGLPEIPDLVPGAELVASIERNANALLAEVAPYALHGLGLAIASAFNRGIGHEAHAAEQLKAKLEDWVAANR